MTTRYQVRITMQTELNSKWPEAYTISINPPPDALDLRGGTDELTRAESYQGKAVWEGNFASQDAAETAAMDLVAIDGAHGDTPIYRITYEDGTCAYKVSWSHPEGYGPGTAYQRLNYDGNNRARSAF